MSFGIPVRNGLMLGLGASTALSTRAGAKPAMFLNFLQPFLDSRITFSRGTNATLIDSTGRLTYAPNNLLLRTTLEGGTAGILGSGAVAPTGWSFQINTGSISYPPALNGSGTASRFVATAQRPFIAQNFTVVANSSYIFSVYVDAVASGASNLSDNIFASGLPVGSTTAYYVNGVLASGSDVIVAGTRVSVLINVGSTGGLTTFRIGLGGAGSVTGDVTLSAPQLEQVTYQTAPGTYNATTASAYYGPRFDYDPVTLAPRGLLIEEARTNIFTYSQQFDDASWVKLNATVTANVTASPDGTVNAEKISEDATAGVGHLISQGPTLTAVAHTFTTYAKAAERNWICLFNNSVANVSAFFNLATGTIGTVGAGATAIITNAGNGWYRCSITFTALAGVNNCHIRLAPSDNVLTYNGVTGNGAYVYGAQLEAGSFATSYIPTVASTVTRNADVATMTGTNFSSWYNQSEGSFVVEVSYLNASTISLAATAYSGDPGTTNSYITYVKTSGAINRQSIVTAGVGQGNLEFSGVVAGQIYKMAGAYKVNDVAFSVNGAAALTDATVTLPTPDGLAIGFLFTNYLNGHIRTIAYFNTRLPNAQLQTLTAPSLATTLSLDFTSGSYNVGF